MPLETSAGSSRAEKAYLLRGRSQCIRNRPEVKARYETTRRRRAECGRTAQTKRWYLPWIGTPRPRQMAWTLFLKIPVLASMSILMPLRPQRRGTAPKTLRSASAFVWNSILCHRGGPVDAAASVAPAPAAITAAQTKSFRRSMA
jgi:hypothetical protein